MKPGKRFEDDFKKSLDKMGDNVSYDRLHDPLGGFKGHQNICDFIVYYYPNQFYFELKSRQGKYFNINDLSDNQYNGLLKKSKKKGVVAGLLIEFRDNEEEDRIFFVPIKVIENMKKADIKSLNPNLCKQYGLSVFTSKKRTRYTIETTQLLKVIQKVEWVKNYDK